MCDGCRLSRGTFSTFSVSTDFTGLSSGTITVCSTPLHLGHMRSAITHAIFFSPRCDSPSKYEHVATPNPLANTQSFQLAPSDGGFSDCGFFALLFAVQSLPWPNKKTISGVPIVPRDGKSVCRCYATGPAWAADGLSQDLFGRTGQPPIRRRVV